MDREHQLCLLALKQLVFREYAERLISMQTDMQTDIDMNMDMGVKSVYIWDFWPREDPSINQVFLVSKVTLSVTLDGSVTS